MTDPESRWRVFRTGLLRSAGFPFEWLDDLASQALDQLSTLLVDAHARRESARAEVLRALWELRRDTQTADMPVLNQAIRKVRRRKTVTESHTSISAATARWNTIAAHFDSLCNSLRAELSTMLPAEYEREVGLLLKHVTSDYFKDAVLLSSPLTYEACCRASDDQGFRRSKDELAAYRFLQRFSAKNETGGSIGPLNLIIVGSTRDGAATNSGEIQYADDPVLGRIEYIADGDGRSAERRTFLSYWAACEIGRSLIQDAVAARYARQPYRIFGAPGPDLPEADARLLSRIDGQASISALASDLAWSEEAIDISVSRLVGIGLVEDDWRVPHFTTDPGEDLRKLAAQIGTPDAQRACQLIADVKRFAQTPFEDRPALLSAITRDFSRLTTKPAWRGPGQLRADRAVLYEEATSNIRAARIDSVGAQRLAERLSTALDFLASVAIEKRAAGQSLLARELARRKVCELPATEVRHITAGVPRASPDHMTLRERFLHLLDPSASCAEFSRHELSEAGLIRGDLGDWPVFGAADLMLTGPDYGDVEEPGSIILSELHHIWPTLGCWVRALYDDSELGNQELWQIVARELSPAVPTLQEIVRHEKATDSSPYGHTVLCLDTGMPVPDAVTVPADRAVVRRWQNGFIGLHDPASQRDLWLLPEYGDSGVNVGGLINCAIPALSLSAFALGPYTPRIIIDGVVVQRRRWEVGVADIPRASGRVPTEREWLALQIWRRGLGLPKCTYFLPDTEGKPVYLDFSSVLSVTNFLRCVRSAQRVVLTEALPDPERLWLRTKNGTLTSEIRTLLWRDRQTVSPPIHPFG
ncbi:MAG: hypothetical protein GEV12_13795 [Micromonosporaceae bacterium]|nr:hypothetical protein [Micromonosporaceae bacterium]